MDKPRPLIRFPTCGDSTLTVGIVLICLPTMLCVTFLLIFSLCAVKCVRPVENICLHPAGRRIYVDLGETGTLTAFNLTSPNQNPAKYVAGNTRHENTTHQQCSVEIVTCSSCVIRLAFRHLNLSHQCGGGNFAMDSSCRCDYVWVSEPPTEDRPGRQFCGKAEDQTATYESKTRTLNLALIYSEAHQHAFTISYTAKRNRQVYEGSLRSLRNSTGIISSPFFPSLYPRDLASEYLLNCVDGPDCRVRIIFTDFQLGAVSFFEFFDGENRRLDVVSGLSFRPRVIISSGPMLLLRFYANGGSATGFKANYSFITESYNDNTVKPNTDCGGFVEDFGGAITMMNMAVDNIQAYDCVWLIRPPENFLHLKTHLFLKVSTFFDFAGNTELQIRQGLTSDQPVLETLLHPVSQFHQQRPKEHIIPVATGFYVRLKGSFNAASRLAITYAAFSYNKCFPGSEFLCANHRCIPGKLSCDSFDHCGDNSDEPASCYQSWDSVVGERHLYSQTPNYFFPKTDRYADLKTATIVFLVSSLGLIILISALIILLYRMNSRARQQRELQSHLQTISELLADNARIEEIIPDDPPDYEPPPEYRDVLKAPPLSTSRRKRRLARHSTRRSRSTPSESRQRSTGPILPILEVVLPPERRNNLAPIEIHRRSNSNSSVITLTGNGFYRGSPIPDSPPPPYSPNSPEFDYQLSVPITGQSEATAVESPPTTWRVTAVTTAPSNQSKPHRRSQSCGGTPSQPFAAQRRLTQSNPLTPYESPRPERVTIPSPTTDSDVYLFSSLESTDFNASLTKPKDILDWEEFDKQFPGKKDVEPFSKSNVQKLLKKYDALLFNGCRCEGACGCATTSMNLWNTENQLLANG